MFDYDIIFNCRFTIDDFVEGMYRTVPTSGTQYELVFLDRHANRTTHQYRTITLMRPFAPLTVVTRVQQNTKQLVRYRLVFFTSYVTLRLLLIHCSVLHNDLVVYGTERVLKNLLH